MKIQVIGKRVPVPPTDGGALAVFQMLQILSQTNEVTFISLSTARQFVEEDVTGKAMPFLNKLVLHPVDTKINPFQALKNLFFSNISYNLLRFINREFNVLITNELKTGTY